MQRRRLFTPATISKPPTTSSDDASDSNEIPTETHIPDVSTEVADLKEEVTHLKEKCCSMEREINMLRDERNKLKEKLQKVTFSMDSIISDNDEDRQNRKMRFYAGLPSMAVFMWIFSLVNNFITKRQIISSENQLLLTLMKLRLELQNTDLAYRFGISSSTVSLIINECIPILSQRLKFLIKWPSTDTLTRNMPEKFKKRFSKCKVIIDCTEFFMDRPFNLKSRAQTWSNYKHHHTLKALIGITPYGSVSFLSKLWGGRISDKEITEKSGFYRKIQYGDQVMADRGFTISHELAKLGATLVMPPFTKGRKQLPGHAVERARQLSALRIHVERAIERIKNFSILKSTLPITLVPLASDILTVCAALTNLQPKLIK